MTAPDSRDSELLTRIMNAQPFTDRNDAIRVWQLFRDDVHVGDAIRAILAFAPDPPDRLQALARGPQQAGGEDGRNMSDGTTFEQYRDALAVGGLTPLDQMGFDNLLDDELGRLQAEVARLNRHLNDPVLGMAPLAERMCARVEKAEAALREAGRDAERWRFLTSMDVGEYIGLVEYNNPDELAHAIDAARLVRDGDSGEGDNNGESNV